MAIKFAKHTFAHLQNAPLHRYLDSQYVTADDSVLSFLNLTEVFFLILICLIFQTKNLQLP